MSNEIELGGGFGVWRVHLPNLFKEIGGNPQVAILQRPIQIVGNILHLVAERATEINDPVLNKLMIQLTLYSVADPNEPDHNPEIIHDYLYGDAGKPDKGGE